MSRGSLPPLRRSTVINDDGPPDLVHYYESDMLRDVVQRPNKKRMMQSLLSPRTKKLKELKVKEKRQLRESVGKETLVNIDTSNDKCPFYEGEKTPLA